METMQEPKVGDFEQFNDGDDLMRRDRHRFRFYLSRFTEFSDGVELPMTAGTG